MRQAERKFITSTHIPDLDNANVGTYMITFFIESLITGDTLVSPVFHRMMILKTITMSSIRNQVDKFCTSTAEAGNRADCAEKGGQQEMITVNGKETEAKLPVTAEEYLTESGYRISHIAVELNGEILPKRLYAETILRDGDVLEVVSFVGGG